MASKGVIYNTLSQIVLLYILIQSINSIFAASIFFWLTIILGIINVVSFIFKNTSVKTMLMIYLTFIFKNILLYSIEVMVYLIIIGILVSLNRWELVLVWWSILANVVITRINAMKYWKDLSDDVRKTITDLWQVIK